VVLRVVSRRAQSALLNQRRAAWSRQARPTRRMVSTGSTDGQGGSIDAGASQLALRSTPQVSLAFFAIAWAALVKSLLLSDWSLVPRAWSFCMSAPSGI